MKVLKERIDEIMTLIAEVANGNFDYQIEASETGDELDAVISGISMLGQELKSSTVSRDFMHSIYQGVVDMLLILNTDFTIRNVNEAFVELLGYKEEELVGRPLSEIIQEEDKQKLRSYISKFGNDGKCLNVELCLHTKRFHTLPASCSFSYLRNNKKEIDGILIIAKDITEAKKTERELKEAKERAEAANEAKTSFLSSMSHEIRTPLNGILGFTDLLLETELGKTQDQYVRLIKASGSTLSKLLKDIMDLHRIEQDKISFEKIPFNLRENVASNLEPYRHLAQSKNLAFAYTFSDDVPVVVSGDPTRIGQVLINLVSNSIKFTETGGVKVHFSTMEVEGEADVFQLKCTITDTGIGVPAEKQAVIFDSFTQSDQTTSRRFGGFGLGLAISKKLVSLMQGEMGITSPPPGQPQGSCFWFTIRLEKVVPVETEAEEIDYDYKLPKDTRILVVDDNEINVMLLQTVLEDMGATVKTAYTGEEAVVVARSEAFDLIFMDIQMPVMDGLEATTLLRKLQYTGPVIAFSANAYKEDIRKSLAAGMNDHLCKPLEHHELVAVLKKWLPVSRQQV